MLLVCRCRIAIWKISIDSNIIWEKAKSFYDTLKQKEGEGSKGGEFNARNGCLDNFTKRFDFNKSVQITGEAASADHVAADKFPDAIKKIIEEKGYLPGLVFNADEITLFWEKKKKEVTKDSF